MLKEAHEHSSLRLRGQAREAFSSPYQAHSHIRSILDVIT